MINKKNIILLLLTINFSCNMSQKSDNSTINALIETNKGEIITELFFKQTPVTVANFISLSEGNNKEVKGLLVVVELTKLKGRLKLDFPVESSVSF